MDEQPQHEAGCARAEQSEHTEDCAACIWARELLLDIEAWDRWVALFRHVPVYVYWRSSGGAG